VAKRTDDEDERGPDHSGFPGGSPRLPRLNGTLLGPGGISAADGEPSVMFVNGGFVADELTRARQARARSRTGKQDRAASAKDDGPVYATFSDYSPTDSLFFHPAGSARDGAAPAPTDPDAPTTPYALLGVAPDASWKQIKLAHRNLLAELHPDRFVTASEAERRVAAERLAEVNLAFHTLDKERRAS
jgi:hypothetical protein